MEAFFKTLPCASAEIDDRAEHKKTTMFMALTMEPSNSNTIVEMDTEQHNNNIIYFGS